jgi:hypothetical protein
LVNTTTSLRLDETLEKGFFRVINPVFITAIEKRSQQDYVDVQLARRGAPHGGMQRVPDTDILGIYIPHSRLSHHPAIKVFPERVLSACEPWRREMEEAGSALTFAERYPTLLYKVIIHELAHYLMDDRTFSDYHCRLRPWTHYVRSLEDIATKQGSDAFVDDPIADAECEELVNEKRYARMSNCSLRTKANQEGRERNLASVSTLHEERRFVEESLANAFVLRQDFGHRLAAVRVFMDSQSEAYKSGMKWHGDLERLLEMASEWRRFKSESIKLEDPRWTSRAPSQQVSLTRLVESLRSPLGVVLPFKFQ